MKSTFHFIPAWPGILTFGQGTPLFLERAPRVYRQKRKEAEEEAAPLGWPSVSSSSRAALGLQLHSTLFVPTLAWCHSSYRDGIKWLSQICTKYFLDFRCWCPGTKPQESNQARPLALSHSTGPVTSLSLLLLLQPGEETHNFCEVVEGTFVSPPTHTHGG